MTFAAMQMTTSGKRTADRFTDLEPHRICEIAYGRLGEPAKAKLHHDAVFGIALSIKGKK